jgi:maltose O-acetyltransferase
MKSYNNFSKVQHSLFTRLKFKVCLSFARSFPLNSVRVEALRLCNFKVGKNVYIGPDLIIVISNYNQSDKLEIGDRVSIGPRATFVLDSDANWSRINQKIKPKHGSLKICNDSWLGANVTLLPGVEVGEESMIGAGAVVTKNVEAGSVYAGVPARFIKTVEEA